MLGIPADVLLQAYEATLGQTPFLIENLSFSDWASLVHVMQSKPQELDTKIQDFASNITGSCRKAAIENRELNLIIAKAEKIILELHGYDSSHLDSAGQVSTPERTETFSETYISRMSLSQVELEYFRKKEAERRSNAHTELTPLTRDTGHKFAKNSPFPPLKSNTWTEKAVQHVHNRLWKLDTFNYTTLISVEAYMALARITDAEVDNCRSAARNGTIYFPATRGGFDAEFPPIAKLEKSKCPNRPLLHQKGIPKFPAHVSELKKLWNAVRPYPKCACPGCEKNFMWFDHMIWYIIGNLNKIDPLAPSDKIRMLEFQALLRTSWRKVILAQISFIFMREYMIKIVNLFTQNRRISAEEILEYEDIRNVSFVHKFTAVLLPSGEGLLSQRANAGRNANVEDNSPAPNHNTTPAGLNATANTVLHVTHNTGNSTTLNANCNTTAAPQRHVHVANAGTLNRPTIESFAQVQTSSNALANAAAQLATRQANTTPTGNASLANALTTALPAI
ncbi:hypothetical protein CBR_g56576 [Chara braunii]|uniref:Uncharacterized protein n=1 Tax=Chara braunii TaxID=69332 RepID=A0A388MDS2_CHABU|nr:hypothetical protein CBR_g56576 [Chara braunii]|eukprot:GBG92632.1 hypothetical protein CBR_g56576 [Chara braunii]